MLPRAKRYVVKSSEGEVEEEKRRFGHLNLPTGLVFDKKHAKIIVRMQRTFEHEGKRITLSFSHAVSLSARVARGADGKPVDANYEKNEEDKINAIFNFFTVNFQVKCKLRNTITKKIEFSHHITNSFPLNTPLSIPLTAILAIT